MRGGLFLFLAVTWFVIFSLSTAMLVTWDRGVDSTFAKAID
jgi:hypothetical protein